MIVVSLGPDASLAREAAVRAALRHDPSGENTSWIDGRDTPVSQIAAAVGSVGFFGGRAIVVTDLLARASKGAATEAASPDDEAPAARGKGALDLTPLLSGVADANLLVLLDPSLGSVPAAIKRLLPDGAEVLAGEPLRGHALLAWMSQVAAEAGGTLDRRAAQAVAESLYPHNWSAKPTNPRYDRPPDMERLRNEVQKLVLAAHPGPVEVRHVREMTPDQPEDKVFTFIDAATSGDLRTAFAELDRLVASGEEPAKVVAQLLQQIELIAVAGEAGGRDPAGVGRDLGLSNPQRMTGLVRGARNARVPSRDLLRAATGTDRRFKQGRLRHPDDSLTDLLAQVAAAARERRTGGR